MEHTRNQQRRRRRLGYWALSLLLFTPSFSAQGQTAKDIALLLKASGTVEVSRDGKAGWQSAKNGLRLNSGSVIRTGDNSLASIVFTDDKSLLKIRSNSRVTIQGERAQQSVKKTISMMFGELWAKVTHGNPFRVETPTGVAAVKGTEFYIATDENGNTLVFCLEGIVELLNKYGNVDVGVGEKGQSGADGSPVKGVAASDELPNWGGLDNREGEIIIEFENDAGQKKILKIRYK